MRPWIWVVVGGMVAAGLAAAIGPATSRWLLCENSRSMGPHTDMARYLLSHGARVDATNSHGSRPLHGAAGSCSPETQQPNPYHDPYDRMRNFGGDAPCRPAPHPWLTQVAMTTTLESFRHEVPPDQVGSIGAGGNTPLHVVACNGNGEAMAELLLDQGAAVDAKDGLGLTPLIHAIAGSRFAVAELLLEEGADPNARDRQGNTALHLLASPYPRRRSRISQPVRYPEGYPRDRPAVVVDESPERMAELLIEAGADPDARDATGQTPLQRIARVDKHPYRLVRVLVEAGAEVNAGADRGEGALDAALDRGINLVADYLQSQGARQIIHKDPLADLRRRY